LAQVTTSCDVLPRLDGHTLRAPLVPPLRMAPPCPTFQTAPVISYPAFVNYTFPAANTATSRLHVLAPWDARLGLTYTQAVSPPDATTAVSASTPFDDQYVQNLITPATTSGATNCMLGRYTSYCMELMCSQALATTGGVVRLMKWPYGSVPVVSGSTAPEFYAVTEAIIEQQGSLPRAFADFLQAKCLHASMRDRTAIEFVPFASNSGNWTQVYGNTSTSLTAVTTMGVPWSPICVLVTGTSLPEYTITIRATVDMIPSFNTAFWRLAKIPPSPKEGMEERWWPHQRQLELSNLLPASAPGNRSIAGYTGLEATTPPKAKAKPKAKAMPAPQPAPSRARVAEAAQQLVRQAVTGGIVPAIAAGVRAARRRQQRPALRNDLRR